MYGVMLVVGLPVLAICRPLSFSCKVDTVQGRSQIFCTVTFILFCAGYLCIFVTKLVPM